MQVSKQRETWRPLTACFVGALMLHGGSVYWLQQWEKASVLASSVSSPPRNKITLEVEPTGTTIAPVEPNSLPGESFPPTAIMPSTLSPRAALRARESGPARAQENANPGDKRNGADPYAVSARAARSAEPGVSEGPFRRFALTPRKRRRRCRIPPPVRARRARRCSGK